MLFILLDPLDVTVNTTVRSIMPNISQAKKYVYTCGASYCFEIVTEWNCDYCQKAKRFGLEFAGLVENTEAKTTALFTLNKKDSEIVITFRGTINTYNIIQDVAFFKADTATGAVGSPPDRKKTAEFFSTLAGKENSLMVHIGFLTAVNSIYPKMVVRLKELLIANPNYNLVITGHSLGAAVGAIAMLVPNFFKFLGPYDNIFVTYLGTF
jgi:hypothetical protein